MAAADTKTSIREAMEQQINSEGDEFHSNARPVNCKQNHQNNTDLNSSIHPSADASFSRCGNCKRENDIIEYLMKKIIELTGNQDFLLNRLLKLKKQFIKI